MKVKDLPKEAVAYSTTVDVDVIIELARGDKKITSKSFPVVFCIDHDERVWGIKHDDCFMASGQLDWEPETEVFEIK